MVINILITPMVSVPSAPPGFPGAENRMVAGTWRISRPGFYTLKHKTDRSRPLA